MGPKASADDAYRFHWEQGGCAHETVARAVDASQGLLRSQTFRPGRNQRRQAQGAGRTRRLRAARRPGPRVLSRRPHPRRPQRPPRSGRRSGEDPRRRPAVRDLLLEPYLTPLGPAGSTVGRARIVRARDECRSEEHTSELQSLAYLVCRLLLEKKKIEVKYP